MHRSTRGNARVPKLTESAVIAMGLRSYVSLRGEEAQCSAYPASSHLAQERADSAQSLAERTEKARKVGRERGFAGV
jgi:uncharacterized protein (DUF58 family)